MIYFLILPLSGFSAIIAEFLSYCRSAKCLGCDDLYILQEFLDMM